MGLANFIKKRFLNKEICLSINNGESETVIYEERWLQNRECFQGVVEGVEDGVIILNISNIGIVFINSDDISYFWLPNVDIYKAFKMMFNKNKHK